MWPVAAHGQQPAIPVIGFLSGVSLKTFEPMVAAFHRGLKETGYVEGQNVTIEYRWAEGQYNQLPSLAADLVGRPVAVIAATGGPASGLAAKAATPSIPIVFLSGSDPVNAGLVGNLARPEGNATGVTFFADTLMAKRFELMRELVPNATAIAVLINPMNVDAPGQLREVQAAARAARQELFVLNASTPSEIDAAFAVLVKQAVGALLVAGDPMFVSRREQIGSLVASYAIPAMYNAPESPTPAPLTHSSRTGQTLRMRIARWASIRARSSRVPNPQTFRSCGQRGSS